MPKVLIIAAIMLVIPAACKKEPGNTQNPGNSSVSVLTQHNDNSRAGLNDRETILNTSNVSSGQFGKLFDLTVDDEVYAQPLVCIPSGGAGTQPVVYIATVNNSIYAYDALKGDLYWMKNYTGTGLRPPNVSDISAICFPYPNFTFNFGIVGTPVIDQASGTLYFVSRSTDGTSFHQYLHAVGLNDGIDKPGSPAEIRATVRGTGYGNGNDTVSFDPLRNNQRQGLALVNGIVYVSWSSHGDCTPYHGWIIGYDAATLSRKYAWCDTPDGVQGGIWESGMGIAADGGGNIYVTTGNGTVGLTDPADPVNRSESAIKLSPSGSGLVVGSFFTPYNYVFLNENDLDYGTMGTFLIPGTGYYLTGCKDGNMYLVDKDNMGGWSASSNNIRQTIKTSGSLHCQPSWYSGSTAEYVYVWSGDDNLRAIPFIRSSGTFSETQILSNVSGPKGDSGAEISVSSNGKVAGTGIVWASYAPDTYTELTAGPGILRAFDANDITSELWNSGQSSADNPGNFAKFSAPTIANGHVYLATFSNRVVVYGLKQK